MVRAAVGQLAIHPGVGLSGCSGSRQQEVKDRAEELPEVMRMRVLAMPLAWAAR